jgi:hypothetical protein
MIALELSEKHEEAPSVLKKSRFRTKVEMASVSAANQDMLDIFGAKFDHLEYTDLRSVISEGFYAVNVECQFGGSSGHGRFLLTTLGQQNLIAVSESISSDDFLENNWRSKEVEDKLDDLSPPLYTLFKSLRDLSIYRHERQIEFRTEKERRNITTPPSQISFTEIAAAKLVNASWDTRDHLQIIQRSLMLQLCPNDVPIPWQNNGKISLGRQLSM